MSRGTTTIECGVCGNPFQAKNNHIARGWSKYCSRICRNKAQRTGRYVPCAWCGNKIYRTPRDFRRSTEHFCDRSCAASLKNSRRAGLEHPNYTDGCSTYRARALAHYGERCMNVGCEINAAGLDIDPCMLDVHHIDGDRANSALANLEVLCVWCHRKKTAAVADW